MKILWVTINRDNRIATIFDPLRIEVSKIVDVDVVMRTLDPIASVYQRRCDAGFKDKQLIDPKAANGYSHIMVDAPFAFMDEKWSEIKNSVKMVLFEDQHGNLPIYSQKLKRAGFDVFFTRYRDGFLNRHEHLKDKKIFWLPHSIDEEVFYDYGLKKEIEALMIGRIQSKVYPIRNLITEILQSKKYFKRVQRPEETFNKKHTKWPIGKDYAKLINSAKITFSCLSSFYYPVLKFFEIPGANSCLCSDYNNELKDLGFIPDENMIEIKNSKENIIEKVEFYLKNGVDEITKKGYELIHTRHTSKARARDFLNYIEDM